MEEKKKVLFYVLNTKEAVVSGLVKSPEQVLGLTSCVDDKVTVTFELREV